MWHPESGTKIFLEYQTQGCRLLLANLRDNDPRIPFPGKWDFPGGGVEPGETLLDCAYRELEEEFAITGVHLTMLDVVKSRVTPGKFLGRAYGRLTARQVGGIVFGPEGQSYDFVSRSELLSRNFVSELRDYALERILGNSVLTLEQIA